MTKARDLADLLDASGNIIAQGTIDGRDLASDGSKLDGIESGATADQTHSEIRALIVDGVDTNVFTDADHTKLDGIEANATADQTASEIKTSYESNANTNAFTDTEQSKLSGVEAGATADQTASEIRALVESATDSNVFTDADHTKLNAIESGATADQTKADIDALNINADTLDGQHGSYYTGYTDTAVANLVDSAPGTLDTLNELAAALGDDPNFATTVTNSIATKLPLAGGTMTGDITFVAGQTFDGRDVSVDGTKLDGIEAGATGDQTASEIRSLVEAATDSNVFTDADHSKLNAVEANAKDDQTITAGSGLTGGGTGDVTLSHSDTSSQGSVNNSGATVVQDVTLDTYGHVTGLGSHTLTLANLGYTGAANANYITNNNQLSNGAGYTTNVGDITNVTAGTNLTGGGSSGSVTVNLTASPNITSLNVGGTEVISNSRALNNITSVDATTVAALSAAGVGGGAAGAPDFPDWLNPDATLTWSGSTGTYTKPAGVADDDLMYVYMVTGGGAGTTSGYGGGGGYPKILYGLAGSFDGFTYHNLGGIAYGGNNQPDSQARIVLTAANGGIAYYGAGSQSYIFAEVVSKKLDSFNAGVSSEAVAAASWTVTGNPPSGSYQLPNTSGTGWTQGEGNSIGGNEPKNGYFGGGGGGGVYPSGTSNHRTRGGSFLAGEGAQNSGSIAAQVPGGGGAGATNSTLGKGADGNIRIYYL